MHPIEVLPVFAAQLRGEYERCAGAGDGLAGRCQREGWAELLSGGGPDAEPGAAADGGSG